MREITQFRRNFNRQKIVGLLGIGSLALGVMVSVVVGLWTMNELSFDNFHAGGERMYRIVQLFDMNGRKVRAASAFKPQGEIAAAEIPEIENMCRVVVEEQGLTLHGKVAFGIRTLITDNNFFSFFSFPLTEGDPSTLFSGPDNVIITESAARKYYPNEDPVGQPVSSHGYDMTIAGVMRDFPKNSHIRADFVLPLFGFFASQEWDSAFKYDTYFLLRPGADVGAVEDKLTTIYRTAPSSILQSHINESLLEPLADIHFSDADLEFDSAVRGNKGFLGIFVLTALIILVISCINFTNLFVSTSFLRAKAIGVKKSCGATKGSLMRDFYIETLCYVAIAVAAGLLLAHLSLPVFNSFVHADIAVDPADLRLWFFLLLLTVVVVAMAGSFPALYMTRFGIVETLRGRFRGRRAGWLQKGLMTVQFTASILLLIVVIFFGRQIDAVLNHELGFDKENVIYVNGWGSFGTNFEEFRREMTLDPAISDVAMQQYSLPMQMGNGAVAETFDGSRSIMVDMQQVTPNYFDFFGMEFVWGENPLELTTEDNRFVVVNERAMELLGLEYGTDDPEFIFRSIGGSLDVIDGKTCTIRGVVRDSYVKSLYEAPGPMLYLPLGRENDNPIYFKTAGDPQKAMEVIEEKWTAVNPDVAFEPHFLDEAYDRMYRSETDSRNVLSYALVITILITVAGLFAMNYYMTQRRVKEIGIRKINGAMIGDLLLLLNRGILWQVALSFALASAVGGVFLHGWLKGFIVRTPLDWWIFALAGILACLLALATVSWQTWKTATANPVESLKSE